MIFRSFRHWTALPSAALMMSTASLAQAPPAADAATVMTATAMKREASDSQVRAFYEQRGWQPIWTDETMKALIRALERRAAHGLDRVTFLPADIAGLSGVQREVAFTTAALSFAGSLASGRVNPATLHEIYTIPVSHSDLQAGLMGAIGTGDVGAWLAGLAPETDEYRRLSAAYLAFEGDIGKPNQTELAPQQSMRVGEVGAQVAAIARQLIDDGYLEEDHSAAVGPNGAALDAPGRGTLVYSQKMADAVKQLQRDYGIAADGIVGPDTFKVLNLGAEDRARVLAVALERRRWLSRTPPPTRIDVNTAAAQLRYYRDGQLVDERKVIVGEPGKETPALLAPIYRLVANPTWTVPKSIQNGELKHVGRAYLRAHNMVMRGGWIVQRSGPSNALGMVKFDMKDDQAIYLHDTSSPGLFQRSQRHLSHGCVRVYDAEGFARLLAEDQGIGDRWRKASGSRRQTFVPLPHEIPVRLLYQNAFVKADGRVAFRTDPYGWNGPIAIALGFTQAASKTAVAQGIDISP